MSRSPRNLVQTLAAYETDAQWLEHSISSRPRTQTGFRDGVSSRSASHRIASSPPSSGQRRKPRGGPLPELESLSTAKQRRSKGDQPMFGFAVSPENPARTERSSSLVQLLNA